MVSAKEQKNPLNKSSHDLSFSTTETNTRIGFLQNIKKDNDLYNFVIFQLNDIETLVRSLRDTTSK